MGAPTRGGTRTFLDLFLLLSLTLWVARPVLADYVDAHHSACLVVGVVVIVALMRILKTASCWTGARDRLAGRRARHTGC